MVRFALENGMRGLVDPSGRSDAAGVYVWINVGSADEPPGMEGAAHFVEHMVFKGTRSHGVGEVAAAIEDLGGDLNAWTSFDETVFHATVPANAAPAAMAVLAEMLRTARFDADELVRERTVILEEIRGTDDDPDTVLSEATYATAWPDHPYGRPVIGTTRSVRRMSRDALRAFYDQHYQPSNACLAVAGPVDAAEVSAAAARLFGGGSKASPRPVRAPGFAPRRPRILRRGFEACLVDLAFPGPGVGEPGLAALDVACLALGGGTSSPLEARLRLREGTCLSADAGFQLERDAGMAIVSLHAREGHVADAVAAAREEIARVRAGGLDVAHVERAKAQLLADRIFGRETVDGRAHTLAWNQERYGNPDAWKAYDEEVAAIDLAAVTDAALRWLAPEREIALALVPASEKVSFARGRATGPTPTEARAPARAPSPWGVHVGGTAGAMRRVVLDNGLRVLLEPDDGEVAAVRVAGLGGALAEHAGSAGRGTAWARALVRGSGDLDAIAFAEAVEGIAGAVAASGGRSSQGVRGEFVAARFDDGLVLLADVLMRPRFAAAEVKRVQAELREALAESADHPEHLLSERVWAEAFGEHPYALPILGTRETVRGLRRDQLLAHHAGWASGRNLVVAVTGAFDPDRVLAKLRATFGALPSGDALALPARPVLPRDTREVTLRSGREQAHIAYAYPGVSLDDPHQPDLEVLAAVLGGQGGRLFVELREAHGLAYAVSASSHEGVHPGLLVCSVATDPDRLVEAEARLGESLDRVASGALTDAEIDRARRYILGATALDLQTAGARANLAAYTELYGDDGLRYREIVRERLTGVRNDEVRRQAARFLARPVVRGRLVPTGKG